MDIEFTRDGRIVVLDDKGKVVVGVVHATVSMNAAGVSEAMLYVNVDHFKGVELHRASDGVRETREHAEEGSICPGRCGPPCHGRASG